METVYEVYRIKQVARKKKWKFDKRITSPDSAAKIAQHFIGDEDREVFFQICLNTKNEVIAVHRIHVGAINASIVHPREAYKVCLLYNACSVIFFHNHPSYDTTPSDEDLEVTRRLKEAGQILGIDMLDHIIVSPKGFTSLKAKGKL
ncbi:DNA repair protein RadC [Bacillus toyonensis]|uniref:JAB domain-containing protein n=1 Tax=Bacillus TaxID=1386 RepID=UPI000BF1E4E2|nr:MULTISPECIES: JAB domain-containing protein [Bacillus]PEK84780.1 DNA repair protein RadC [Bacillus toyonensis]